MSDLTGTRLAGFTLSRKLGAGGFGDVYLGEPDVGAPKAIKVLQARDMIDALRSEAQTLAALQHPNIVSLSHADLSADPPFMVMDHVLVAIMGETRR